MTLRRKIHLSVSKGVLVRVVADIILINIGYLAAKIFAFFWNFLNNSGRGLPFKITVSLPRLTLDGTALTILGIVIFSLSGFYTKGRVYRGRYKLLMVFQAVSLLYLLFSFSNHLLVGVVTSQTPAVLVFAWLLTWISVSAARLYSMVWRQVVIKEANLLSPKNHAESLQNILIIGGAGYVGSVLCQQLVKSGFRVRVLDALLYGGESIQQLMDHPQFEFIQGDSRDIEAVVRAMKGMEAVVHLGEIVGDPATTLDEQLTQEINVAATKMVAQAAKGYGARRFVYASSCSVYGASPQVLTEHSLLNPLSLYARAKVDAERTLLTMNNNEFHPVILRFATVYGLSPRPRFDLVLNLLTAKAIQDGEITINGGEQWRPFVHVVDIAKAIYLVLSAPLPNVKGQIFNIGTDEQNYTIAQLGEMVKGMIPEAKLVIQAGNNDHRNYRVSFAKVRRELSFSTAMTIRDGISEIQKAVQSGILGHFSEKRYSNYKTLSDDVDRLVISRVKINELYAPKLKLASTPTA